MASSSFSQGCLLAAAAAACVAFAAQAEEFSWQLSGSTRQAEGGEFETWALDATFYMKPIADSSGPYALASFLHPTTRVSATASRVDTSQDPTAYTIGGAYVLPGDRWYVGADYARSRVDDVPLTSVSGPEGYGVHAGRYLGANTTLELRLGRSEQQTNTQTCGPIGPFCTPLLLEFDSTTDSVGLEVFHVRRFRSLTYSLQGGIVERDTDAEVRGLPAGLSATSGPSLREYSVAAELFPTDRLGVRVGYSRPEDFDVENYDVAATWYFKPRVAVQFGLSRIAQDDASPGFGHFDSAALRFIAARNRLGTTSCGTIWPTSRTAGQQ
jgi:hypothetical protein